MLLTECSTQEAPTMRRSQTHWPSRLLAHNTFTKSDPRKDHRGFVSLNAYEQPDVLQKA